MRRLPKGIKASIKKRMLLIATAVFVIGMWQTIGIEAAAQSGEEEYASETADYHTGYEVIIEDDADLLTDEEEESLYELMNEITLYGNIAFKTIDYNDYSSTERYILDYYDDLFGISSGGVFLIDMDYRNIWIRCHGSMSNIITDAYTDTITDNVYTYASDADYYGCAYETFSQMLTLLQGHKIAQPMKYISNAFLAMIIGLLITYFIVKLMSVAKAPSDKQLMEGTRYSYQLKNPDAIFTHETKKYDPPSSSSGGSGGGGGGGGGGSSGGHSF